MSISSIYNYIVSISPKIEVIFRIIYWNNIKRFHKFKPKSFVNLKKKVYVDFNKIIDFLGKDVREGDLMILHSSYDALEGSGLSPNQILDKLVGLLGDSGTLALPVIRKFKGEPKIFDILKTNTDSLVCPYDVRRTPVWTGFLPFEFMNRKGTVISRFPLNPLAASGKLADAMICENLKGDILLPHGKNSCWKFCLDNNAIIVGLGINLAHSLTLMHTIEDCQFPNWPIKDWYRQRKFHIKDGNFEQDVTVLERRPKWGMLFLPEINFRNDLIKNGILTSYVVEGVQVEVVYSKKLYEFLEEKNITHKGYPYSIPKKYMAL